ncbi:hypothetical protein BLOT_004211 [Blomia tropicalis]|nr:hypothetical protein BLOT_004211 [Blomia tropicalis]
MATYFAPIPIGYGGYIIYSKNDYVYKDHMNISNHKLMLNIEITLNGVQLSNGIHMYCSLADSMINV